ncbi:MAG: glycoside hydrolase N-terminal domain-containing protein [Bacteroidales bacterium]|nr:glycoside hydrolase N-terminal domain-containing protein [Bacteroidales bacterium]
MANRAVTFTFLLLVISGCSLQKSGDPANELWYNRPAADWNEALPVGNGRLGAMVFGDPVNESVQLNEESIWAGSKINNNNPSALKNLPALQKAILDGEIRKAEELASSYFVGTPPRIRSYQPLGDLRISYQWGSDHSAYRRSLDIESGIAETRFRVNGKTFIQRVFASAPDNVIVIDIRSMGGGRINALFELVRSRDAVVTATDDGRIILSGQIRDADDPLRGPGGDHMRFAAEARFSVKGGSISAGGNAIRVADASGITILLTAATNYNLYQLDIDEGIDPAALCSEILNRIRKSDFRSLLKTHLAEHREMFRRVSLELGPDTLNYLPTDERLERIKAGGTDNGLVALYFSYGRYLLMGSSRYPAVLPANLQGIWNKEFNAPWNSDFHTNINLQMNYWPAEICNLPETSEVLAGFISRLTVPGSVTAREMYGADGWTMHHLTDPFGRTGVADGVWGLTPTNGPWMTFPLYEHFLFTRDMRYLREIAWPVLKGSAQFLLDFLIPSPEGYLVTNPSTSPENRYRLPDTNESAQLTYAATIDIQTVNAVFDYCVEAATLLGTDEELVGKIKAAQAKLPPVRISDDGTIQEWIKDYEEVEPGHRHMSHLLGLYPLAQITPQTPALFEAAGKTIGRRLSRGGGHTGWSRAWIINFYARLQRGDDAWEHIMALLSKSTLKNLFDSHPPFQIDGNFGGTAGIAEMLLQSHQDYIELLPALPSAWKDGRVRGLVARGGFIVDIEWRDGIVSSSSIRSTKGGVCRVKYGPIITDFETDEGGNYFLNKKVLTEVSWKASPKTVERLSGTQPQFNYHEERVPEYTLPDPLVTNDGRKVKTRRLWKNERRHEILEIFRENVYGRVPDTPWEISFNTVNRDDGAMGGKATLKEVDITITSDGKPLTIRLTLFVPNNVPGPVPAFLLIDNRGPANWDPQRKVKSEFWPAEEVVARGYCIAVFSNADVDPDSFDDFQNGIHGILDRGERRGDSWGTLAAWAWGASRCMDYFERDEDIDERKVAVVGHSRGGKTALWAGAEDERFAMVVANESGCGGAALARRRFGETIARINSSFPHWFCLNYRQFGDNEDALPVDMHMLIALIAPRAVYVTSASDDLWADPRGSYLSLWHASPVYHLFKTGTRLPERMPPLDKPVVSGKMAYHVRSGAHNMLLKDWNWFMDFGDLVLK